VSLAGGAAGSALQVLELAPLRQLIYEPLLELRAPLVRPLELCCKSLSRRRADAAPRPFEPAARALRAACPP